MNPRFWSFDLEMNKPSNKIIQIGCVVGRLDTGQIISEFNHYINPHEQLSPFIIELTGIPQDCVDASLDLLEVSGMLDDFISSSKACKSPIVWGNGDLRTLKAQCGTLMGFQGIHREIDIKTIYQWNCLKGSKTMRGGLVKAMESYGLPFVGTQHNALHDARNTFTLARKLFNS